jgi:serine/threonine-protein kinase
MAEPLIPMDVGETPIPAAAGAEDALPSTLGAEPRLSDKADHQTPRLAGSQATISPPGSAAVNAPAAPALFGSYELLAPVAEGGMGIVYKARDLTIGRLVALKMLRGGSFAQQEDLHRFFREVQAAGQLQHPNIVAIFEVGQFQNHHYYTMAFVAGGSLAQQLDRFREPRAAVALVEKVARAVQSAHEHGILHRDLKPGNILIDDRGEPLVSDFGLAKFLSSDAVLTQSGDRLGTPAYMSPEQAAGKAAQVSAQSDVWAMGVILYELLTGTRPFRAETPDDLYRLIRESDPIWPRKLKPELPRDLETIVLKCLENEPGRRYASAAALAEDLAKWMRGEPILARPLGLVRRVSRRFKTHGVRSLVGAALVATAVTLALLNRGSEQYPHPTPPPDEGSPQELTVLQNDLDKGGATPLLLPSGEPRWYKVQAGHKQMSWTCQDGLIQIDSGPKLATLALMREPTCSHYVFHADVLHEKDLGQGDSNVGLYILSADRSTQQGMEHDYVAMTFRDQGTFARDEQGQVYSETGWAAWQHSDHGSLEHFRSPMKTWLKFQPQSGSWRHLAVRVTPTSYAAFWDGAVVSEVSRAEADKAALNPFVIGQILANKVEPERIKEVRDSVAKAAAGEPPRYQVYLGLYVDRGIAKFRDVRMEPFKPQ